MTGESFIDVDHAQRAKAGQLVSGDVFASRRIKEEGRVITVLSDGLGSGVKAGVLAQLTATMALRYTAAFVDVRQSAGTIMSTLPICEVRKISYSTFTITDLDLRGRARLIEHGNPPFVLLRGGRVVSVPHQELTLEGWSDRNLRYSEFDLQLDDRLVCFSDGITQSGLGRPGMPFGWGDARVHAFLGEAVARAADVSSHDLAQQVVAEALAHDQSGPLDDMTCGVVYYRQPRRLLVITGPPFARERDAELAELVLHYPGRKAICGGTTATIVGRQLRREVETCLDRLDADIPPGARMDGVDLVTEGTMTLARVAEMLERGDGEPWPDNPARALMDIMLQSDIVDFVVGTRINEAHQDPNVPVELDLRRNIIRRLVALLESRHLKATSVRFV
ncbi:MAG: serine/threonine-protein phosphatase [Lentisphaerae bacterium]|nr:serine/threonine-protein phosphatase [Lentisphaerota bacterium]